MNAHKATNKGLKSVQACHSHRGHYFEEYFQTDCPDGRRYAKKVTRRANRRLNKALVCETE